MRVFINIIICFYQEKTDLNILENFPYDDEFLKLMICGLDFSKKTNKDLTEIQDWEFNWWYMEDDDIISQFKYNNHECHLTKRKLENLTSDRNTSNNIIDSFV